MPDVTTAGPGPSSERGLPTSVVVVHDVAASWEGYAAVAGSLTPVPEGLVLHAAGPTDEGFRIVEVWETESASARFRPVLQAALRAVDPVLEPLTVVRELRATHVVVAAPRSGMDSAAAVAPATE